MPDASPPGPTLATVPTQALGPAGADAAPAPPPGPGWPLPPRYQDLGLIASGAMGTVRRVRDHHLDRVVAMKLIRVERADDPAARERFLAEARLTARLQHPGIVPVHDWGALPDGQRWFTMKEVRGQTLTAVIRAVHRASTPTAWQPAADGWTLRRLVDAVIAAARAVAYAHGEGVVHRDLKPDNIMVGAFGEVQVMDWGVARSGWGEPSGVAGTPAYMAPEQAAGGAAAGAPAVDVYGLGAVLHTVLTGQPPYPTGGRAGLAEVLAGPPVPIEVAAPRPLPADLAPIAQAAMARDAGARTPSAGAFAAALQAWLDGALRQDRALALVAEAKAHRARAAEAEAEAQALEAQAQEALAPVPEAAPVAEKAPGWALEAAAQAATRRAQDADLQAEQVLHAALRHAPELGAARRLLAAHYRDRLTHAEAVGDPEGQVRFEGLLRSYDDGQHAAWLAGDGVLTLVTDPPGVPARLWRLAIRDRQRQPVFERDLGPTPLRGVPLGRGSWVVTLERPGAAPVIYPVHIGRGEAWDGVAPGEAAPHPIWVPGPGALAEDEVYVPAGWFTAGGDADALDALPRRRYWLDGFTLGRHPVTHRQYLAFINGVLEGRGRAAAESLAPIREADPAQGASPLYRPGPDGAFTLPADAEALTGGLDCPVNRVDWPAAAAYAAWAGRRLPHDLEWEKAARGVDARSFPWGDTLDPAFCAMQRSFSGPPRLPTVHEFPADRSVYGVRGLGGLVRELCANGYERFGPAGPRVDPRAPAEGPFRMSRGGCIAASAPFCRAAGRFAGRPEGRLMLVGFRVARSVP